MTSENSFEGRLLQALVDIDERRPIAGPSVTGPADTERRPRRPTRRQPCQDHGRTTAAPIPAAE